MLNDLRRSRGTRLMLVLAYAVLGIVWILASGALVNLLPADAHANAENVKGIAFVLVTGVLLWAVILVRDLKVERERAARLADVTARIQAVEHHRRLAGAIEATPLGVAVLAHRGDGFEIAYANRALASLIGVPAAELLGQDPLNGAGLFGLDGTRDFGARLAAGEPFEADALAVPRGDQPTPVRVLVSPVAARDDAQGSVVVIVLDRGEAMAREAAEARLGMVLDASPAPIVAINAADHVTEWNPAAERAFGWR
ncbi:MAG: PAS domain-containing protein, partial [Candidatus Limnocylindrales bacterium]